MSGRVLNFEGHAHRDVERLLPWYANATLEGDDDARVRAHLLECAACRADLATMRALMDHAPVADARDIDRGWIRMRDRLHAARYRPAAKFDWLRVRSGWSATPAWLRVALAAQCAFIAVLAMFLVGEPRPAAHTFTTLSATPAPRASQDTLLVVFDPRITDAQLRELLGANRARIVDGPNAAGAFLLATPPGQADAVRNALRASPGVAMAERLAPPE
ncbi:zf-HC2 domain containing protein [Lysobacter dokdonensis DS-58]|uniref:Zf-HC2 domain containing protein n=1 Tax=Lysobacter dokdonensis DS-58 TaxID=1300345 RepID=A0A0A2WES1_9GAMM|nr:zf-HC2 domain-containing protein [Lysobacter dokdonensis]KGQ18253.1 zf-HC2 domain containing protein [Lysobacter dokdonensis DS-58]